MKLPGWIRKLKAEGAEFLGAPEHEGLRKHPDLSMTKPLFRLNSRGFSEATPSLHHGEAESSPERPVSAVPGTACPGCGMAEGTDPNLLVCSWRFQRSGRRALGRRQAGGIVALKMVLYCACSVDVLGISPSIPPGQPDPRFCLPFHAGSAGIAASGAGTSFLDVRVMLQGGAREWTPERGRGRLPAADIEALPGLLGAESKALSAGASGCERPQDKASLR